MRNVQPLDALIGKRVYIMDTLWRREGVAPLKRTVTGLYYIQMVDQEDYRNWMTIRFAIEQIVDIEYSLIDAPMFHIRIK